jgi:DnaK suppressor protein
MTMTLKADLEHHTASEYMNEAHRAHFKQILCNWKQALVLEDAGHDRMLTGEAADGHTRQVTADPLDRATQMVEIQMELLTLGRLRRLVTKIDNSIEQIDHNGYGYCDSCGTEIGVLRLQARPTATQCVDCKSIEELKERQVRG